MNKSEIKARMVSFTNNYDFLFDTPGVENQFIDSILNSDANIDYDTALKELKKRIRHLIKELYSANPEKFFDRLITNKINNKEKNYYKELNLLNGIIKVIGVDIDDSLFEYLFSKHESFKTTITTAFVNYEGDLDDMIKQYPALQNLFDYYIKKYNVNLEDMSRKDGFLSRKESAELCRKFNEEGDSEALETIIAKNVGLVKKVAASFIRHMKPSFLDFDDLVQEGTLGLIRAAKSYNSSKSRFSTYSLFWIKQAIKRAIEDKGELIRLPSYRIQVNNQIRKKIVELHKMLGRNPTEEEIMTELKISKEEIKQVHNPNEGLVRLDKRIKEESDSKEFGDFISDKHDDYEDFHESDTNSQLNKLMKKILTPREYDIIRRRVGLDTKKMTLKEVGAIHNLTRERIRQLEQIGLRKIKTNKEFLLLVSSAGHDEIMQELGEKCSNNLFCYICYKSGLIDGKAYSNDELKKLTIGGRKAISALSTTARNILASNTKYKRLLDTLICNETMEEKRIEMILEDEYPYLTPLNYFILTRLKKGININEVSALTGISTKEIIKILENIDTDNPINENTVKLIELDKKADIYGDKTIVYIMYRTGMIEDDCLNHLQIAGKMHIPCDNLEDTYKNALKVLESDEKYKELLDKFLINERKNLDMEMEDVVIKDGVVYRRMPKEEVQEFSESIADDAEDVEEIIEDEISLLDVNEESEPVEKENSVQRHGKKVGRCAKTFIQMLQEKFPGENVEDLLGSLTPNQIERLKTRYGDNLDTVKEITNQKEKVRIAAFVQYVLKNLRNTTLIKKESTPYAVGVPTKIGVVQEKESKPKKIDEEIFDLSDASEDSVQTEIEEEPLQKHAKKKGRPPKTFIRMLQENFPDENAEDLLRLLTPSQIERLKIRYGDNLDTVNEMADKTEKVRTLGYTRNIIKNLKDTTLVKKDTSPYAVGIPSKIEAVDEIKPVEQEEIESEELNESIEEKMSENEFLLHLKEEITALRDSLGKIAGYIEQKMPVEDAPAKKKVKINKENI